MNKHRCGIGKLYYTYLFMHFHVKPVGHFVILNVKKYTNYSSNNIP
jgi:hypothetical protein